MRDVIYLINDRDEISSVNDAYDDFALANDGGRVTSKAVLGRSLWDFVADDATVKIYRDAVTLVRSGRSLQFGFRCDSPTRRRLMLMNMGLDEAREVRFCVRTVATEDRPPERLFVPETATGGRALVVCSWCKKIRVGNRWEEMEDAVASLHLLEEAVLPSVAHRTCAPCHRAISSVLDEA